MPNFFELEESNQLWEMTTDLVEALRQSRVIYAPEIESIVETLQTDTEAVIEDPTIKAVVGFARKQLREGVLLDQDLVYLIDRLGLSLYNQSSDDPNYNERLQDDKAGVKLLVKNLRLFVYTDIESDQEYTMEVLTRILKIILNTANERSGTSYHFKDIKVGHLDLLQREGKYHCKVSISMNDGSRISTMLKVDEVN